MARRGRALWNGWAAIACALPLAAPAAEDLSGVVDKVRLGVVLVKTDEGSGTGWIADAAGRVVTNYHVIAQSSSCTVTYKVPGGLQESKTVDVRIVAVDPKRDLAVLQLPRLETVGGEARPDNRCGWARLATGEDVSLKAGESVFVIGNPGMGGTLLEDTVTNGIVSNPSQILENRPFVQITAPVNSGNSGGPLFNKEGVVIGVITLKGSRTEGVAFASHVKEAVDLLSRADQAPFKVSGSLRDWEKRFAGDVFLDVPDSFVAGDLPHPASGLRWHAASSRLLVLDTPGNQIHVMDPEKGKIEKSLFAGSDPAFFDVQGESVVVGGPGGRTLRWINLRTGKEEGQASLSGPPVSVVALESKTAAVALSTGSLLIVTRSREPETVEGVALGRGEVELGYDPGSKGLYVAQVGQGELHLWAVDMRRGGGPKKKGGEAGVQDMTIRSSEYGTSLIRPSLTVLKGQKRIFCAGMAFDAKTLAPAGQVKRYALERKELLQVAAFKELAQCPESVFAASPDGRFLVGPFHLFDAASLTLVREMPFPCRAAAFDAEGKTLFIANPVAPVVYRVPFQAFAEGR